MDKDLKHENVLNLLKKIKDLNDIIIQRDVVITLEEETRIKLFNFCHSLIPNVGRRQLRHFFKRNDCIFVNENVMSEENESKRLQIGDHILIHLRARHFLSDIPLFNQLKIHFCCERFSVIEKPAGVVSDEGSLFEYIYRAKLWEGSKYQTCFPLYRIEERLSGLMLIFRNINTFRTMSRKFGEDFLKLSCMIISSMESQDFLLRSSFDVLSGLQVKLLSSTMSRSLGKVSYCQVIPTLSIVEVTTDSQAIAFTRKFSGDLKRIKTILKTNGLTIVGLDEVGVKQKGIYAVWNEIDLSRLIDLEQRTICLPLSEKFQKFFEKEIEFREKKEQRDLNFLENITKDESIEERPSENGKPIEYLVERAVFAGHVFYVNESVLIPRKSSEVLVNAAIDYVKEMHRQYGGDELLSWNLLDLGTGSGCLLLSLLSSLRSLTTTIEVTGRGIDLSDEAIAVAQINSHQMNLESHAEFSVGDITNPNDWLSVNNKNPIHIIICNPPYSSCNEKNRLSAQSKQYEPSMALFADKYDSLKMYRKIVEVLLCFESNSGGNERILFEEKRSIFILEVGRGQLESVISMFSPLIHWKLKDIQKDYKGMNRCLVFEYQ